MVKKEKVVMSFSVITFLLLAGCAQTEPEPATEEWDYSVHGIQYDWGCVDDCAFDNTTGYEECKTRCGCERRKLYGDSTCKVVCEKDVVFDVVLGLRDGQQAMTAQMLAFNETNCSYVCYGEFRGWTC